MESTRRLHPKVFFEELRQETAAAFLESPVKELQQGRNRVWNYSICATPIRRNAGIIFGLNWGGGGDSDIDPQTNDVYVYPPQCAMPDGDDVASYRFIRRSLPYLTEYLKVKDVTDFNYSNLCFFRTPKISDLRPKDWELSSPLFLKYVEYLDPPWLLMLGTTGLPTLETLQLVSNLKPFSAQQNGRTQLSYSGTLREWPFVCVPHPQAQLQTEVRHQLWADATGSIS